MHSDVQRNLLIADVKISRVLLQKIDMYKRHERPSFGSSGSEVNSSKSVSLGRQLNWETPYATSSSYNLSSPMIHSQRQDSPSQSLVHTSRFFTTWSILNLNILKLQSSISMFLVDNMLVGGKEKKEKKKITELYWWFPERLNSILPVEDSRNPFTVFC